jgi:hypothetical protein
MGLLDRFEQRLDRLVNGAFAKAFKAQVQPVEIASALQREMDDRAAVVSRGRTVVPNVFTVDLSEADSERLMTYDEPLRGELVDVLREYAEEQRYTFLGSVEVTLRRDDGLDTGIFRLHSEARAGLDAPAPATTTGTAILVSPDGTEHRLNSPVTRIGRGTDVDLRIDDPGVSRHHAEVVVGADVLVRDLGSTNGTKVDGNPVAQAFLTNGSLITLGTTTLTFRIV